MDANPVRSHDQGVGDEGDVRALYQRLIGSWNRRDALAFAALFDQHANVIGFNGSMITGRRRSKRRSANSLPISILRSIRSKRWSPRGRMGRGASRCIKIHRRSFMGDPNWRNNSPTNCDHCSPDRAIYGTIIDDPIKSKPGRCAAWTGACSKGRK